MQLKDQVKKNWKVVAAVTAVSAIGLSGLALADARSESADPDPINLSDRTEITEVVTPDTTVPEFNFGTIDPTNDSPFDSLDTATASAITPTPDSPVSPATPSPDSPATPDSPTSPDTASVDSP